MPSTAEKVCANLATTPSHDAPTAIDPAVISPAQQAFEKAFAHFECCRFFEALALLLESAKDEYPPAYLLLYNLYCSSGLIGPKDPHRAAHYKKLAGDQFDWYKAEAEKGGAVVQWLLAYCYEDGIGVEKDKAMAMKLYRSAAVQGLAIAQFDLALCLHDCKKRNASGLVEAVYWCKRAAKQEYAPAECHLGFYHEHGIGVKEDETEAMRLYHLAAEQGLGRAMYNVGICAVSNYAVPGKMEKGVQWLAKAAVQGDVCATRYLLSCVGIANDLEQREAADVTDDDYDFDDSGLLVFP